MARFDPLANSLDQPAAADTPRKARRPAAPKASKPAAVKAAEPAAKPAKSAYKVDVRKLPLATFACLTGNADTAFNTARRDAFGDWCDAHPQHAPDWRNAWRAFAGQPSFPTDAAKPTNVEPMTPPPAARPGKVQVEAAMRTLSSFMGRRQTAAVRAGLAGEERDFFVDKMLELAHRVETMPKTYDQDGMGDDAIVSLHYFAGGAANWWITEKDKGAPDDRDQHQAFGLVNLYGGADDPEAELGYVSLVELLANHAELDFYFSPLTLRELKRGVDPALITPPPVPPENAVRVPRSSAARAYLESL